MSDKKMNVVFASAEAAPFVKTGGLGDVAGSLPAALTKANCNVVVMVPLYSTIDGAWREQMTHVAEFYVSLGWRNVYCGLERLDRDGVTYLFVDNEHYFQRSYPYGFFDDGERFAFFAKAVTESLQYLPGILDGFTCDILHCNDWHTALAPVFLREFYQGLPLYEQVKTVFSIHNIAFQGQYSAKVLNDVCGLAHIPAAAFQLTCGPDAVNYMQGALNYTDAITTVSPTYAAEIQSPAFGENLDGVLRRRRESLQGIVNGIDVAHFDPATDPAIAANYTTADRSGKAVCKARLQEELGLTVRDDQPLMSMVTRLTRQKGMDLVTYALDRILSGGVQVAVLGTGDTEYENALRYFEHKYPGQMAARIQFDPALSQRMYAGSDLFLMPSLFEPCGLSQMIAMRYGTLPVVRETGGLKDTVIPYNYETGEGTGFSFANFNGEEMGDAVFRGARLFWDDREAWNRVVTQAMEQDFSWTKSAAKYMDLYRWLRPDVIPYVPEAPVAEAAAEEPASKEEVKPAPAEVKPVEITDEPAAEPAKKPTAKKTVRKTATKTASKTKTATTKTAAAKTSAAKAKPKAVTAKATAAKTTSAAAKATTAAKPATTKTTAAKSPASKSTTTKTAASAKSATATKAATTAKPAAAKTTTAKTSAATKAAASKPAAKTATVTKPAAIAEPAAKPAAPKTAPVTEPKTAPTAAAKAAEPKVPAKKATAAAKTAAAKPAPKAAAAAKTTAATAAKKTTATKAATSKTAPAAKPAAEPKPVFAAKPAAKPAAEETAAKKPAAVKAPATKTVPKATRRGTRK